MLTTISAHCPQEVDSESNYGSYSWMVNLPSTHHELPCVYGGETMTPHARRTCNERGIWEDTIFSECWTRSEMMLSSLRDVGHGLWCRAARKLETLPLSRL